MKDMVERLMKLPPVAWIGPTEAKTLAIETGYAIHRGVPGYTPIFKLTDEMAERFNAEASVTPAQLEAMMVGSCFGWHVPGANPDNYETIVKPKEVLI